MTELENTQHGPPGSADLLAEVVATITYKPGWSITLGEMDRFGEWYGGSTGLTLRICFNAEDSTRPGQPTNLDHLFAVPPVAYTRESWERWVLDCLVAMETHEAMEFFKVNGQAPFFPAHGFANGHNPYVVSRRRAGDNLPGAPTYG